MKMKEMKVADFIAVKDYDVDVYDNVCESLAICACLPIKLTRAGKREFADVMEMTINADFDGGIAVVDVDDVEGVWQGKLKRAKMFFYAAAGYVADDDYQKWFRD